MRVVPVLLATDAQANARWYARLGFTVEWTHRFAEGLPLFLSLRNGDAQIFLSEHSGDARPDTLLYLYVDDVDAVAREFDVGVEDQEYGMREIEVADPDGNRLRVGTPS